MASILSNSRYTGRQVWNRQRTDTELVDPGDLSQGHRGVQRWNLPDGWVISERPAHPALVSEADFIAAQELSTARGPAPAGVLAGPPKRRYLLAGLLTCGHAGGGWSQRGPAAGPPTGAVTAATSPDPGRPRNAYVREDRILAQLPALHLLLTGAQPARRRRTRRGADVRPAASPEEAIGYLREHGITPVWDQATGTLRAGAPEANMNVTVKAS